MNVFEWSAAELAQKIKAGELSAPEAVEAVTAAIDSKDGTYNCYTSLNKEAALQQAETVQSRIDAGEALSPLAGVPIGIKDNICTKGQLTTCASKILTGFKPPYNATVIEKLHAAGMIPLGKLNMDEFAMGSTTETSFYGATKNPWNTDRVPGGSSGGTGASIACNIGIIGLGTDTINSVRSPSSANSLVGIRPTIGLVSRAGIVPYSLTQDTAGPICRTVEDAVRCLDVIKGYDPDDAETAWSVGHEECYMDHLNMDGMKGRRIGVLESLFGKEEINESTNKVVRNALKVFEENGATLVPVTDNIDQPWLTSEVSVHLDDFQHDLDGYLATLPADWKIHSMAEILEQGLFHPFSESNMRDAMTREVGSPRYLEKMYNKIGVRTHVLKIMADLNLDAMVYPHQQQLVCKIGANQQQRNGVLCSSTGFPSIAVPAGFAPDENAPIGVPVGMEIIGRPWSEAKLIEIAYAFEQHSHFRRPPVSAPDLNK